VSVRERLARLFADDRALLALLVLQVIAFWLARLWLAYAAVPVAYQRF
jgi:hypothetical protein